MLLSTYIESKGGLGKAFGWSRVKRPSDNEQKIFWRSLKFQHSHAVASENRDQHTVLYCINNTI